MTLYKTETKRNLEMKFKEYHPRISRNDPTVSDFEHRMFRAIERTMGERGYRFPDKMQPIYFKRAS
jgi:hypothetical protein